MRQEQDSLGDMQLLDEEYFGIATARLLAVADSFGPAIPRSLATNIVRVRQAQAMAFGHSGAWSAKLAATIQEAAERLVADDAFFAAQLRVCALHGGGAESLVRNIDEVLANTALQLQHKPLGEYHWVAPLLRLDNGLANQQVCLIALHIALAQMLAELVERIGEATSLLRRQTLILAGQNTIIRLDFQDVQIGDMSAEFACCADSLERFSRQITGYRTELTKLWHENPDVIDCLQKLVGVECTYDEAGRDFPVSADLYGGLSGQIKLASMVLLQFCNGLKQVAGLTKELDLPKHCASPVFNPASRDMIVPATISQVVFQIIGYDATIIAAANSGNHAMILHYPLIATCLINSVHLLSFAARMLTDKALTCLRGEGEAGRAALENTPLQAKKLIPLIGYDRSVQVARIASLTEKSVRTVVARMKLLDEEQTASLFASDVQASEHEK